MEQGLSWIHPLACYEGHESYGRGMTNCFDSSREQSVVNVAGVKFGGQPGELPTVLCGTIFYHGHKIVEDEERGIFDRAAAERLISRQAELSEETGCPCVLHLYARSTQAFEKYLDFAEQVWSGPFIIDSADAATRAQLRSSSLSWDTRTRPSTTASAWPRRKRRHRRCGILRSTRPSSWPTIRPSRAWTAR